MKSPILKAAIFLSSCICGNSLFGQVYVNNDAAVEKHFIYEVKQIDEFFERFNDDSNSFIRGVYKSNHIKFNVGRQQLIKSLFNYETMSSDTAAINRFVSSVTNKKNPFYLDFYGNNWYAELACRFKYNSSSIIIPITMKMASANNKGYKWVIVAVGSSPLKPTRITTEMRRSKDGTKCISPTSHATNFVSLKRAFEDKENLSNCFDNLLFKSTNISQFYNAVLNDQIEFLYVIKVKYHFLVAGKWILTVENFPRATLNSGWLINNIQKVSPPEMESYRKRLLSGG